MSSTFTRLQLATRIHFALLRAIGEGIDVGRMLRQRDYADEVLNVCRGLEDLSMAELADRFDDHTADESARACLEEAAREARRALAQIPRRAPDTPQDMGWSKDTSGFGLPHALASLSENTSSPKPAAKRRFSASDWLGLGSDRRRH